MELNELLDTTFENDAEMTAFLLKDGDLGTPGCHFGSRTSDCIPVAIALAKVYADSSGDRITAYDLDASMGLVVNAGDNSIAVMLWDNRHCFPDGYLESIDIGPYAADDIERWRETGELPEDPE